MNMTLFKSNIRNYWILIVAAIGVLLMYGMIGVSMFNPNDAEAMKQMFASFPEGMMKAFGFENMGTTLFDFVESFMYGFIIVIFPAIFLGLIAHGLIGKHTDKGSMVYILATPNKRTKLVLTQAIFLIISVTIILAAYMGIMLLTSEVIHPGLLDVESFLQLNWITYLSIMLMSSVAFLFSCIFNEARFSLGLGIGLPILFVFVGILRELSPDLNWLKFLSPYTLIGVQEIYTNTTYFIITSIALILASVGILVASTVIFNKRNFIV